tara:strand:- start:67 stop:564 length:498 start_codon:yes stop_codon:yes gene_type:complete
MIALHNFRPDDFAPMLDIVADYRVVEMVGSWPWPAQPAFTKMRLTTPEAQAGKVQAICVNGVLAGTIGLVRGEIGYLLGRRFWGQGFASKAVAGFLAELHARFGPQVLEAGAYADNPASARVLEKLGFIKFGEIDGKSDARLEPRRMLQYRRQAALCMGQGAGTQ